MFIAVASRWAISVFGFYSVIIKIGFLPFIQLLRFMHSIYYVPLKFCLQFASPFP